MSGPPRLLLRRCAPLVFVAVLLNAGASAAHADSGDAKAKVDAISDQLDAIGRQVEQYGENYLEAVGAKAQADKEVAAAQADLDARSAALGVLRDNLSKVALQDFMEGGSGGNLSDLFASSSGPTVAVQKDFYTTSALSAGTDTTDELDMAVKELDAARRRLETKQAAAAALAAQIAEQRTNAETKQAEFQTLKAQAERDYGSALADEQARREAQAAATAKAEYEAAVAREAAAARAAEVAQPAVAPARRGGGGSVAVHTPATEPAPSPAAPRSPAPAPSPSRTPSPSPSPAPSPAPSPSPAPRPGPTPTPAPAPTPNPKPAPSPPPASSRGQMAVSAARGQLGVPYVWGTANPGVSFDCSGLTMYAWSRAGVSLPHQSRQQYASIAHVPISAAQPGDLIFSYNPISHVGIYIGNGQMIHAPNSGSVVNITTVRWGNVVGVGRPG